MGDYDVSLYTFPQAWPSGVRVLAQSLVGSVAFYRREARWPIRCNRAAESRAQARKLAPTVRRLRREAAPANWAQWVAEVRAAIAALRPDGMPQRRA